MRNAGKGCESMADGEIILTEHDRRLLQIIREVKRGEVHIVVVKGTPVRAEEIKRVVAL